MKNNFKWFCLVCCLCLAWTACEQDRSIQIESKIVLDRLTASGKIGDNITAVITCTSNEITKIGITKSIDGVKTPEYSAEIPVNGTANTYTFSQMILAGDEKGTLVFTFTGYDATGKAVDASDLAVSVSLSGAPLLLKYDWRMLSQVMDDEASTTDAMLNNVYRFNEDYSWEFDFGSDGTLGELLTQNCAWKIAGNESKIDSIYLVKFSFLNTTPSLEGYKVLKLEGDNLWLETTMDLSWLGLSAETKVVEKYLAIPKTPDFSPYGSEAAGNYNWGPCSPGTY